MDKQECKRLIDKLSDKTLNFKLIAKPNLSRYYEINYSSLLNKYSVKHKETNKEITYISESDLIQIILINT